jgi:hypothetical protein
VSSQQHTGGVLLVSRGTHPSSGARARARACARGPPRPVGVRQHEQSRKHFSPRIRVRPKIYVGHDPRTTVDFRFDIKDNPIRSDLIKGYGGRSNIIVREP